MIINYYKMKLVLSIILFIGISNAQTIKQSKKMTLYWYQCKHCSTTIKKESQPNTSNCPKKPFHLWTRLAEVGEINYQCKKCGTTIQAKSTPTTSNCPSAAFHQWTKL